ncbi:IS30 family transposase [Turneriella parva]|uniref:Integrase catalytic region n=1 Tax=Turneriella parva (strain ATCC BAA-1111 / DSM 21527 / NCTC 11395 / H) TaxID=869212 RepID=I4B8X9_TURPD|nr:IS30 family transposase [Turneriella parva]AFM10722.1 Integrase catalytic region [Turneriella parva DSM 21527]AFM10945.1 Integrase catalytic region [Turneriella parva DSM 21527]AFM12678.1 Integrase catalytic region [Turneriella parva DSM 21527]AFM13599.1 Integrase catalytic region [Turneriella parva DSM 21527]AFM13736.1 Integrase catalytic region [Turneriella parva DSM 21527]
MRPYVQLSNEERLCIEESLRQGRHAGRIARDLKRHPSTIYREIRRNSMPRHYSARCAKDAARRRQTNTNAAKVTPELWSQIGASLKSTLSPEQIAGRMRLERFGGVCMQTIYNHIRKKSATSNFYRLCLRRKGKPYKRTVRIEAENKGFLRIHDLPAEALTRRKPGYWEGDLVEGKIGTGQIATFVERHSRYTKAAKIERKLVEQFNAAARDLFADVDNSLLRGVIYDRGTEMSGYRDLQQVLNCGVYFCDPGSPWQRGTNENTNGLLREPFPKGTDFREIDQEQVDAALELLNNRPRKRLNFRTPAEVYFRRSIALRFGM